MQCQTTEVEPDVDVVRNPSEQKPARTEGAEVLNCKSWGHFRLGTKLRILHHEVCLGKEWDWAWERQTNDSSQQSMS